jgi:hypothetical protein
LGVFGIYWGYFGLCSIIWTAYNGLKIWWKPIYGRLCPKKYHDVEEKILGGKPMVENFKKNMLFLGI